MPIGPEKSQRMPIVALPTLPIRSQLTANVLVTTADVGRRSTHFIKVIQFFEVFKWVSTRKIKLLLWIVVLLTLMKQKDTQHTFDATNGLILRKLAPVI